ncbi:MAG: MSHA biogenesis protein MshE, partial [Pseudomonadota bacterium]
MAARGVDELKPPQKKVRIGDLLVANGEITAVQLDQALLEQKKNGLKLGRILIDLGYIDEDSFLRFLSTQFGVPFYDLKEFNIDTKLAAQLPETYARRYRALILEDNAGELIVGMADPMDIFAYDEVSRQLKQPVSPAVVRESELLATLDLVYRRLDDIENFASELEVELGEGDTFSLAVNDVAAEDDNTPVARLLRTVLEDAVQVRASDVHIEPDES